MKPSTLRSVFTLAFASLICVSGIITIPTRGPVPITIQNAIAILSGLLLGPIQGAGAVGLFLIAGGLGFPVFSGGQGGTAVFAEPTGGYLLGYFIAALIAGLSVRKAPLDDPKEAFPIILSATISAFIAVYVPGVLILKRSLGLYIADAITFGIVPFLAGDAIKIAILVPIALKVRPLISRYCSL